MKIIKADYDSLAAAVSLEHSQQILADYIGRGLTKTRYLWDLFNLSCSSNFISQLYSYLNDTNIETALKRIIKQLDSNTQKPMNVVVSMSETHNFKDNTEYTFSDFERIAKKTALEHDGIGYIKVFVEVEFVNQSGKHSIYETRIDLCKHETGFQHHIKLADLYGRKHKSGNYAESRLFYNSIIWPA